MTQNTTNPLNILSSQLAASVANGGTVTFSYPSAPPKTWTKGNYLLSNNQHKLQIGQNIYTSPKDFALTFNANASGITVTNKGVSTWPAGAVANLQLNPSGLRSPSDKDINYDNTNPGVVGMQAVWLDLGSPVVAAATNICAAQAVAGAGLLTLNGTLVTNGIAYMDVPRSWQIVSSSASDSAVVITMRGLDEYGNKVTESLTTNGTSPVLGKKAVSQVLSITSGAVTVGTISVGTSNVLGLPVALYKAAVQVVKESQDGAVASAGTFANADLTTPTATTGDVRGTYIPAVTPDGSKGYAVLAFVPDKSDMGVPNYAA